MPNLLTQPISASDEPEPLAGEQGVRPLHCQIGIAKQVFRNSSSIFREKRMTGSVARVFNALHGYVYGHWTKQYIRVLLNYIVPNIGPRGKKCWADRFHFKVLTNEGAKAIVTINKDIPLRDLEQIIPHPMVRDFVLKAPPDIVVHECSCRHTREHPCQPTQMCLIIGRPFVDFILEHHPRSSRRISQEEAVELIEAEQKLGHIQTCLVQGCYGGTLLCPVQLLQVLLFRNGSNGQICRADGCFIGLRGAGGRGSL